MDVVHLMLAAAPALVNAVGPHPFWGGRPQALHVAIESRRRDMFDLLVERGADVSGSNDEYGGWSPLMLAIHRDQIDMRDELLRRGARVGLVEALLLEDDARVGALVGTGDASGPGPNGGSLLAFARTPFAIDRLLECGAPLDAKDQWGATPMEALSRIGARGRALVDHLARRGTTPTPDTYARLGDEEKLARLAAADPSVLQRDDVMMAAVDAGHHALVAWLVAQGGHVNARSSAASHHSALHAAAWNGDLPMVELLVRAGADPTIRDDQYHATPSGWAATAIEVTNNPTCAAIVDYLDGLGLRS